MYIVYIPFVLTLMMVILLLDVFTGRLSPIGDYFYASHTHSSEFSIHSVYYMASLSLRIFSDIIVAANAMAITQQKQMLTRSSKYSSEFPQLEGFGVITHVNIHSHTCVLSWQVLACI